MVGKTTLLKSLIGLRPRSGSMALMGPVGSSGSYQRAGLGWLRRKVANHSPAHSGKNLLLGMVCLPGGLARNRHIDPFVYELFPILQEFLPRKGGDLSGGQQQQLAIARALLGKPKLLLLDEPTEGIQPNIVQDIEAAVRRIISDTGIGVLLVEQHLHFVRQADRYYAMQRGGIVASGSTSELSQTVVDQFLSVRASLMASSGSSSAGPDGSAAGSSFMA